MSDYQVLVVFGGDSWERNGSIVSAATVAKALNELSIVNRMVEYPFTKEDVMGFSGRGKLIVFNCGHGKNGEDGGIAFLSEHHRLPYNFSRPFSHLLGYNKYRLKTVATLLGIDVPRTYIEDCKLQFNDSDKLILKPSQGGGSLGIKIISGIGEVDSEYKSRETRFDPYYIEEFIAGKFITCAVSGNDEIDDSLPLLEVKYSGDIYTYGIKHDSSQREYVLPADIPSNVAMQIKNNSRKLFKFMECDPFVRFDYIVSERDGKPYLLETNTVPGMSMEGNLPSIWMASGRSYLDMIRYLLGNAHL